MKRMCYIYRGNIIFRHGGGWCSTAAGLDIYKALSDAKNAVDRHMGGWGRRVKPKRQEKPVRIIGQFTESEG